LRIVLYPILMERFGDLLGEHVPPHGYYVIEHYCKMLLNNLNKTSPTMSSIHVTAKFNSHPILLTAKAIFFYAF
jgi:hypothetical protein